MTTVTTRDWNAQLTVWAQPPSAAETDKMERAEREIREAIKASPKPHVSNSTVKPQGSYYNRTNVPGESDVDTRVTSTDVWFTDWGWVDDRARTDPDVVAALDREVGNLSLPYSFREFKDEVGEALVARFGPPPAVERGDKAYDIHETRYRVESDSLPSFEVRLYQRDSWGRITHHSGIEFVSDKGVRIQNFPEQQYRNGVEKHGRTGQRFKKMVRILKNLRNEMKDNRIAAAEPIPSFLSECLVWNVADDRFNRGTYLDDFRRILATLYVETDDAAKSEKWLEENGIKYLFHWSQSWTRAEANAFIAAAWDYMGFS